MSERLRASSSSRLERYSGKDLEADFLGEGPAEIRYDGSTYQTFNEAFQNVLKHQPNYRDKSGHERPWDVEDPPMPLPNALQFLVKEHLEERLKDPELSLGFYNALGTELDKRYGIDAILVLESKGERSFVSIDITSNPNKTAHKADQIIHVPATFFDDQIYTEKNREPFLEEWSKRITDTFFKKIFLKRTRSSARR
jgi:hypothetical protein